MNWIGLISDKDNWNTFVNSTMNSRGFIKCWEILERVYNSRIVLSSIELYK
jgi:hypothetical protein